MRCELIPPTFFVFVVMMVFNAVMIAYLSWILWKWHKEDTTMLTLEKSVDALAKIAAYEDNWDGEGTPAPSDDSVSLAYDLLWGMDRLPDHILCSVNGAIVFEWATPFREVEITGTKIESRRA